MLSLPVACQRTGVSCLKSAFRAVAEIMRTGEGLFSGTGQIEIQLSVRGVRKKTNGVAYWLRM